MDDQEVLFSSKISNKASIKVRSEKLDTDLSPKSNNAYEADFDSIRESYFIAPIMKSRKHM